VVTMVSEGSPRVLSDFKPLLETDETLPLSTEPHVAVRLGPARSAGEEAASS
jgi:hypothetical protein